MPGAQTALSARSHLNQLADKAVRAPLLRWFMAPMRDSRIVEAPHEAMIDGTGGGMEREFGPWDVWGRFPGALPQAGLKARRWRRWKSSFAKAREDTIPRSSLRSERRMVEAAGVETNCTFGVIRGTRMDIGDFACHSEPRRTSIRPKAVFRVSNCQ
jgi:hypothetical protein